MLSSDEFVGSQMPILHAQSIGDDDDNADNEDVPAPRAPQYPGIGRVEAPGSRSAVDWMKSYRQEEGSNSGGGGGGHGAPEASGSGGHQGASRIVKRTGSVTINDDSHDTKRTKVVPEVVPPPFGESSRVANTRMFGCSYAKMLDGVTKQSRSYNSLRAPFKIPTIIRPAEAPDQHLSKAEDGGEGEGKGKGKGKGKAQAAGSEENVTLSSDEDLPSRIIPHNQHRGQVKAVSLVDVISNPDFVVELEVSDSVKIPVSFWVMERVRSLLTVR